MNEQFFAGIAGSLLTLLGVLITLRWSQISHERNLAHERLKRKDEREFAARQQTFSAAAEGITTFTHELFTLPDRELVAGSTLDKGLLNMNVALNKLQFYASNETIEKAAIASNSLTNAYAQTVKAKMPAIFLTEEIKALDISIQNFEKLIDELKTEVNILNQKLFQGGAISEKQTMISTYWQEISSLQTKRVELIKARYRSTEGCRDILNKFTPMIFTSQRDLLLSARKELGFDFDTDRYAKFMDAQLQNAIRNMQKMMADIRSEIEKKIA